MPVSTSAGDTLSDAAVREAAEFREAAEALRRADSRPRFTVTPPQEFTDTTVVRPDPVFHEAVYFNAMREPTRREAQEIPDRFITREVKITEPSVFEVLDRQTGKTVGTLHETRPLARKQADKFEEIYRAKNKK